eukprot:TRINITY_DN1508_c0_g3_i1.p1 TRINITY_DN1508_c0_g3~~TRINITY_DN1508_c0_g3_i1.p1  ORF type:complete len:609 (+),score=113.14 TRINITY_DN1508_c0_g3_i1:78-1904(+)
MERPSRAAAGRKDCPMWLHPCHGAQASSVQPQRALRTSKGFCAKAFVQKNGGSDVRGLQCWVVEQDLRLGPTPDDPLVAPLFLAEVSSESLPSGMVLCAVMIPPPGTHLKDSTLGDEAAMGQSVDCWYLLSQDAFATLDSLSCAGVLRNDLDEAFEKLDGDGIIGEGAHATVHILRKRNPEGTPVAVKRLHPTVDLCAIERELYALLAVCNHAHIVGYRGLFWMAAEDCIRLSMIFDIARDGDLLKKVLQHGSMTEEAGRPLFLGIMSGLAYIHSVQLVHRDVKAENILLTKQDHALVSDFGLATLVSDPVQMARRCGSPGYVAPEVCVGRPYGFKVDVFGAGVVLFFMLSQEMPFSSHDRDTAATMRRTVKCSLHLHRPPWDTMSTHLRNYLRQMMYKDQDERLSSSAAMLHHWMRKPCSSSKAGRSSRTPKEGSSKEKSAAGEPSREDKLSLPTMRPGAPGAPSGSIPVDADSSPSEKPVAVSPGGIPQPVDGGGVVPKGLRLGRSGRGGGYRSLDRNLAPIASAPPNIPADASQQPQQPQQQQQQQQPPQQPHAPQAPAGPPPGGACRPGPWNQQAQQWQAPPGQALPRRHGGEGGQMYEGGYGT